MKKALIFALSLIMIVCTGGCSRNAESGEGAQSGVITAGGNDQGEDYASQAADFMQGLETYPGADERILFGWHENKERYLKHEYKDSLHYYDTEVLNYRNEMEAVQLSHEPVSIICSFFQIDGIEMGFDSWKITFPFEQPPKTGTEIWKNQGNTTLWQKKQLSEYELKAAEKYLFENLQGDEAMEIARNLRIINDTHIMEMQYIKINKFGDYDNYRILYVYELDGDRIIYTPLEYNYRTLELIVPPKNEWKSMRYGFRGTDLVVDVDGYEATLGYYSRLSYESDPDNGRILLNGYLYGDTFNDMQYISATAYSGDNNKNYAHIVFADGSYASNASAELLSESEIRLSWQASTLKSSIGKKAELPGEVTFKFVGGEYDPGFVIVDGGKYYYYMDKNTEYFSKMLSDNLDDGVDIDRLKEDEIIDIKEKQQMVVSELKDGFSIAGINAAVDDKTGKVTMDNSILFGFDSDELSPEGEAYLDQFLEVYAKVMAKQSEEGIVSTIKVVGHTDVSGSYDYNLDLSRRRAESVVTYCSTKYPELADMIKAEGKSYSEPVYNEDGTVNMDASRRVEFKAILQY